MAAPRILALDFDGVICDSVREGLGSAWLVYREIWPASEDGPPPEVADAYLRLRPAMEIGWEFPVMLRAIIEGVPEADLVRDFQTIWRQRIIETNRLSQADLTARFDAARDARIRKDFAAWLASQQFYPGIADRLRAILKTDTRPFILTTKEGRYAHLLLDQNGVNLPATQVWGKERARPKTDLLRVLQQAHAGSSGDIWFVEDRLKTLRSVEEQADLESVGLFLATWGYNTPAEGEDARRHGRIVPLTLDRFRDDFSAWPRPRRDSAIRPGAPA